MSKIFFHKDMGPSVWPEDSELPEGGNWFETEEAYQLCLNNQVPQLSLDDARREKLQELREVRLAAEYGGFMMDGQRWDSELKDELRLNSTTKIMEQQGLSEFPGWKVSEGVYITLTRELALQAAAAMAEHYAWCFAEEARQAAEIIALDSVEALKEYKINFRS